ncbi:ESX secretion-associated protein EspG [Actinophytocola glycyrrhizae]|uniref:ESX secretion-associated protein EspG n=1 Tax=Actinophytocola glycyrrhizae TaxID=2044873 RepID=A0ABV9S1V4_9PSEU
MALFVPATVPARVLAWLVARHGLGEPHIALAPTAVWRPPHEPDPWPDRSADWLTKLGWCDRAGRLEREVSASLAVLCRPVDEAYGWITHVGVTIAVLAARIGKDAVLAVRTPDDMVGLSGIPAGRLTERLVAQLPELPPLPGRPWTVSPAEVRSVNKTGRRLGPAGATVLRASPEARAARQLLTQPRTGGGELWVAHRDRSGLRHVGQPVRYADLAGGRVLLTRQPRGVRVVPGAGADLVAALNGAHRGLPRRVRT